MRRLFGREDPGTAFLIATAIVAAVGALDSALPADVDPGEFYMLAVIVSAWAICWRTGLLLAVAGASLELVADMLLRVPAPSSVPGVAVWNGLSDFGVLGAIAIVTDRLDRARR